jgi:DnaJ like chaperone protein
MAKASWIGKIGGGVLGLLLTGGNPIFAAFGVLIGHQFDRGLSGKGRSSAAGYGLGRGAPAERKLVFFESVFLAMGHIAKVDGRVSEQEIQVARGIMHQWRLGPEEVQKAIELFSRGKRTDFPVDVQMQRLATVCQREPELLRTFMEVLMEMPLANGSIDSAERDLLWRIAGLLGVGRAEMAHLEAILRARKSFGHGSGASANDNESEQAYQALGVTSAASDDEVKTAYRRLMNQNHPDKLVAKGLPDSMMEVAIERTREIRAAYELLRDQRGIR